MARKPRPDTLQEAGLAAPMGGINMLSPAVMQPPTDCVYCYNMTARELGLGPRLGSRQYAGGLDGPVRTLLSFKGAQVGDDRLFACTQTGIWNVTAGGLAPTRVVTFGNQDATSGYGTGVTTVDLNSGHNLLYTDESNGYYVYAGATATWVKVTSGGGAQQVSGLDPTKACFVMVWKNHVFLVEKNTGYAWYLATFAIYGTAVRFNFGTKFRAGGALVGLWNCSQSGGLTPADVLVAISSGGDVVVYGGSGPDQTDFSIAGVWSLGDVPAGRNIATTFGGDLLVVSARGAVPLSKLLGGAVTNDPGQYATQKVPTLVQSLMSAHRTEFGWSVVLSPEDGTLLVLVPNGVGMPTIQLAMSLATHGWSMYRGLSMTCSAAWNGQLYYGTVDGSVWINTGTVDGVTLADPTSYMPIEFSLLTSFQAYNTARLKKVELIRTTLLNPGGQLQFQTKVRYGYDLSEPSPLTYAPIPQTSGVWDAALWDSAVWAGDMAAQRGVGGAAGYGPEFAIAFRGQAISKVTLVGWHVFYNLMGRL